MPAARMRTRASAPDLRETGSTASTVPTTKRSGPPVSFEQHRAASVRISQASRPQVVSLGSASRRGSRHHLSGNEDMKRSSSSQELSNLEEDKVLTEAAMNAEQRRVTLGRPPCRHIENGSPWGHSRSQSFDPAAYGVQQWSDLKRASQNEQQRLYPGRRSVTGGGGRQGPYRVLHSYNSPAYRGVPIWG